MVERLAADADEEVDLSMIDDEDVAKDHRSKLSQRAHDEA